MVVGHFGAKLVGFSKNDLIISLDRDLRSLQDRAKRGKVRCVYGRLDVRITQSETCAILISTS